MYSLTCLGPAWSRYEFKDIDTDVIESPVVVGWMKVSSNGVVQIWGGYTGEMAFKPLLDGVFGLTYIWFITGFTAYTINEVVAVACNVSHGSVFPACSFTGDGTSFVESCAISALGASFAFFGKGFE